MPSLLKKVDNNIETFKIVLQHCRIGAFTVSGLKYDLQYLFEL